MARFEICNDRYVFVPTEKHGGKCKKREAEIAWALQGFCGADGRIPEHRMEDALRQGVLAGGKTWGAPRVKNLANMLQLTPPPNRSQKDMPRVNRSK